MSDEYTPTTDEAREQFTAGAMVTGYAYSREEARTEFNRWLAQVKAEAQVEVLRAVAASKQARRFGYGVYVGHEPRRLGISAPEWLREHADRIAHEVNIGTVGSVQCDQHKPVQHRDGKPPWCRACGKTAANTVPNSRFSKEAGA